MKSKSRFLDGVVKSAKIKERVVRVFEAYLQYAAKTTPTLTLDSLRRRQSYRQNL